MFSRTFFTIALACLLLSVNAASASEPDPVIAAIQLIKAGKSQEGIMRLDSIIATHTVQNDVLASAYLTRGEYRRRMRQTAEAIDDLTQSIRLRDSVQARNARAIAYGFLLRYEPALEDWSYVVRYSQDRAAALAGRAGFFVKMDRLALALADCNAALSINPNNVDALGYRAFVALTQRRFTDAEPDVDRAMTIAPDSYYVSLVRGLLLVGQEKSVQAIAVYDAALAKDPLNAALLTARITALQNSDQYARGQADCKLLLTLEPDDKMPFLRVDGPTACAVLAANFGKFDEASRYISRAIAAAPGPVAHLFIFRGLVLALDSKINDALADLDRGLELDPHYVDGHGYRGVVRRRLGRASDAAEDFQAVISNGSPAIRGLGILWLATIDRAEASRRARAVAPEIAPDKRASWPWSALDVTAQLLPPADVEIALRHEDPLTVKDVRACYLPFYTALRDQGAGQKQGPALEAYRQTMRKLASICPPASLEDLGARLEATAAP